jgi:hypothetical protein
VTADPRDGAARHADSGGATDREATPTPAAADRGTGERTAAAPAEADAAAGAPEPGGGFGRRGWILVAVVVLSTLVIPGGIYLVPSLLPSLGVPYLLALLVLPLVPAALLGATAVWSMAASGRR